MTAWLPVALPCLLGLALYRWLLRHAGPWTFAAPRRRRVIRAEVERGEIER
jgi:hypothetical protein